MTATDFAWAALGDDPALPSRITTAARPGTLPSRLPVRAMARACVGVCAPAAAELGARRAGRPDDVPAVDVLRVDPPGLPELAGRHADTGFGNRSATLDLTTDRQVFENLLATADVVVTGYRPGALDRFGLSARAPAERRPGIAAGRMRAVGRPAPAPGSRDGQRAGPAAVRPAAGVLRGRAADMGATARPLRFGFPALGLSNGAGVSV
ncbi:CoA transferase [Streptomyces sp. NBC_00414]|uniref:CoA transferase n=1 Tax=Streptomyces sp. NBC_00414 TaxID=2975739 RepID=UPI0030E480AB